MTLGSTRSRAGWARLGRFMLRRAAGASSTPRSTAWHAAWSQLPHDSPAAGVRREQVFPDGASRARAGARRERGARCCATARRLGRGCLPAGGRGAVRLRAAADIRGCGSGWGGRGGGARALGRPDPAPAGGGEVVPRPAGAAGGRRGRGARPGRGAGERGGGRCGARGVRGGRRGGRAVRRRDERGRRRGGERGGFDAVVCLDLARLDRVLEVDVLSRRAVVGAGSGCPSSTTRSARTGCASGTTRRATSGPPPAAARRRAPRGRPRRASGASTTWWPRCGA